MRKYIKIESDNGEEIIFLDSIVRAEYEPDAETDGDVEDGEPVTFAHDSSKLDLVLCSGCKIQKDGKEATRIWHQITKLAGEVLD